MFGTCGAEFYHIIFLDHMMPEMDGVETLKRLKQMNLSPETKIIVLTANAITGAREKYLQEALTIICRNR